MGYPTLQEAIVERFSYTVVDTIKRNTLYKVSSVLVVIGGCIMGRKQHRTRK